MTDTARIREWLERGELLLDDRPPDAAELDEQYNEPDDELCWYARSVPCSKEEARGYVRFYSRTRYTHPQALAAIRAVLEEAEGCRDDLNAFMPPEDRPDVVAVCARITRALAAALTEEP